jgi:hypothetical protein
LTAIKWWSPAAQQPASISSATVDLFSPVLQPSTGTPVPAINIDADQQTFDAPLVEDGALGLKNEEKAQQQYLESSNVDYDDGQQIYGQVADLLLLDGVVKEDDKRALEDYYYEHDVEPGFWDEAEFYNDLDDDDNRNMKNVEHTDGLSKAERAIEAETNREFSEEGEESSGHRIGRSVGGVHHDDNGSLS